VEDLVAVIGEGQVAEFDFADEIGVGTGLRPVRAGHSPASTLFASAISGSD
jgi:hypothetical protein